MRKIFLLILGLCAFLNAENLNGVNSNATKSSIVVVKEQNSTDLAIKDPKTGAQSPNAKKQAVMKPETSKSPTVAMQKSAAEANSSVKASAAKKAVSAQLSQTEKKSFCAQSWHRRSFAGYKNGAELFCAAFSCDASAS